MRRMAEPAMLAVMAGEASIVLRLELDDAGDAIRGRVSVESGWAMPFVGWLGLAVAIERATSASSSETNPHDAAGRPAEWAAQSSPPPNLMV